MYIVDFTSRLVQVMAWQQVSIWTNFDQDPQRHMALLGDSELVFKYKLVRHSGDMFVNKR